MKKLLIGWFNLPNMLTIFRIVLIFFFASAFLCESYYYAITIYLVAGLTDLLDGYIARKFQLVTSFGKLMDPLADKLLQITAIALLTYKNFIPWQIVVVVGIKELLMLVGACFLYKRKDIVVSSDWFGKLATFVFFAAVILCVLAEVRAFGGIIRKEWITTLMIIAVCTTFVAFYGYLLVFIKAVRKKKTTNNIESGASVQGIIR